jgi:hypothetical protein
LAEFDYDTIKSVIRDILRADTALLYDATGEGTKTKFVEIETGFPNDTGMMGRIFPFCFITMFGAIDFIKLVGSTVSDNIKGLEHTMTITVAFAVNEASSKDAEEQLDDFTVKILNDLETDPQLKNGGTPNVDQIVPERIEEWITDKLKHGTNVQGRLIHFKVTKMSGQ